MKNKSFSRMIFSFLVVLAFSIFLATQVFAESYDNKISDYECTDTTKWSSNIAVSLDTNTYYSGTTSIKIGTASIPHYGVVFKSPFVGSTFPFENGKQYKYTFWVRVNNNDLAGIKLTIPYYYKKSGETTTTYVPTPNYASNYHVLTKTDQWQLVSGTFTADLSSFANSPGATPVELDFQMSAIKTGGGTISNLTFWMDKFNLRIVPAQNEALTTLTNTNPLSGTQNISSDIRELDFNFNTTYIDDMTLNSADVKFNGGILNKSDYTLSLTNNASQNTFVIKLSLLNQSVNFTNKEVVIDKINDFWGRAISVSSTFINQTSGLYDNKIGDYECTDTTKWSSDIAVSLDTNTYYSGSSSIKIGTASIPHYGAVFKYPFVGSTFPLENGKQYTYTFWARVNNADLAGIKLTIPYYYKKSGETTVTFVPTPNYSSNYHVLAKTDQWQLVSGTFTADLSSFANSPGATPVELDFQMSAIKSGGGTISNLSFWVDKVNLREVIADKMPEILLDENFQMTYTAPGETATHISGWDVSGNGGYANGRNTSTGFEIVDNSSSDKITISKTLKTQSTGIINFEFRAKFNNTTGDTNFRLSGDTDDVIKLQFTGGKIYYKTANVSYLIGSYTANNDIGVKAVIDLDGQKASIYCNDNKSIYDIDLYSDDVINKINIETGNAATGETFLKTLGIYTNYIVKENFISNVAGSLVSSNWIENGTITLESSNEDYCDTYNLLLADTSNQNDVSIKREFNPEKIGKLTLEYKFLASALADFNILKIQNSNNVVLKLSTTQGGQVYYGDNVANVVTNYQSNLWYHVKIILNLTNNTANIYVNHKLKNENVSITNVLDGIDNIIFSTSALSIGNLKLDNICLYKNVDPVDYVATPNVVSSEKILAMLSCNIWSEGSHRGWDSINRFDERKPLLGYFDEANVEAADWQIKWLTEHGIGAQIFCWFNYNTDQTPIKTPKYSQGLDAYLDAKYSDLMDFSILWVNSTTSSSIFRNTIIPYWMEYYFKDSRYLKIDNKPVLFINSAGSLLTSFGSYTNVASEINYLNTKCIEAGFSGITICVYPNLNLISQETKTSWESAGINSFFTYGFGSYYNIDDVKDRYEQNPYYIPVLSVTQNPEAWTGLYGRYTAPNEFRSLAEWYRDVLLPNRNFGNVGDDMVIIGNWNEFGEGHYLMPTNKLEFSNLDVIRDVFTTANTTHTDIAPTETQKARFNNLYDPNRVYYEEPILENNVTQVQEIQKWTFNSLAAWQSYGFVAGGISVTSYAGTLKGINTNNDPMIIKTGLNIDITNSKIIKIRIKSKGSWGQIFFGVAGNTGFSSAKSVAFCANPNSTGITEYEVDMRKNSLWTGTLTDLRLDIPGVTNDEFELESISIMGDDLISVGDNIVEDYGFEDSDDLQQEFTFNNCTASVQHKEFYYGASAMEITKTSSVGTIQYALPDLSNEPQDYYYSFFTKQPYGVSDTGSISIYAKYIQNGNEYTVQINNLSTLSNNYWDESKGIFTIGNGLGSVTNIRFYIDSTFPIYNIDNLKIMPLSSN